MDAALARYDQVAATDLPPDLRAQVEELRARCLELRASLTDEAIEAELEATVHAGRGLTPAEVRGSGVGSKLGRSPTLRRARGAPAARVSPSATRLAAGCPRLPQLIVKFMLKGKVVGSSHVALSLHRFQTRVASEGSPRMKSVAASTMFFENVTSPSFWNRPMLVAWT